MLKITYIKSIVATIAISIDNAVRLDLLVMIGISVLVLVSLATTTKTLPLRFKRPKTAVLLPALRHACLCEYCQNSFHQALFRHQTIL